MSVNYAAILWSSQKKKYDKILWAGILLLIISFAVLQLVFHPDITAETIIIRATALTAVVLLHIIAYRAIVQIGHSFFALAI